MTGDLAMLEAPRGPCTCVSSVNTTGGRPLCANSYLPITTPLQWPFFWEMPFTTTKGRSYRLPAAPASSAWLSYYMSMSSIRPGCLEGHSSALHPPRAPTQENVGSELMLDKYLQQGPADWGSAHKRRPTNWLRTPPDG